MFKRKIINLHQFAKFPYMQDLRCRTWRFWAISGVKCKQIWTLSWCSHVTGICKFVEKLLWDEKVAVGESVNSIQDRWGSVFNISPKFCQLPLYQANYCTLGCLWNWSSQRKTEYFGVFLNSWVAASDKILRKEYGESAYISAQFSFVSIEWTIRVEEIWQK